MPYSHNYHTKLNYYQTSIVLFEHSRNNEGIHP